MEDWLCCHLTIQKGFVPAKMEEHFDKSPMLIKKSNLLNNTWKWKEKKNSDGVLAVSCMN